ncbi:MAG: hypothetical protein GY716_24440 [bacterium]|nr:hypothetical protein [bacterium]
MQDKRVRGSPRTRSFVSASFSLGSASLAAAVEAKRSTIFTTRGGGTLTVLDEFNQQSFGNNDGSDNWEGTSGTPRSLRGAAAAKRVRDPPEPVLSLRVES